MNRKIRILLTASLILLALAASYAVLAHPYRTRFFDRTFLNGVDISRLTLEEAEKTLDAAYSDYSLSVTLRDAAHRIDGSDIRFRYAPGGELEALLDSQNPLLFVSALFRETREESGVSFACDDSLLEKAVLSWPEMQEKNMIPPQDAGILFGDPEFFILPEEEGTTLDPKEAQSLIRDAIRQGLPEADLSSEEGLYAEPAVREDDEWIQSLCDSMNELASASVTWTFPDGSERTLNGSVLKDWLVLDETGLHRDDESWQQHIRDYVSELADAVNTVYTPHTFRTINGETRVLPAHGYYGWRIGVDAEVQALTEELSANARVTREPRYLQREAALPWENGGFGSTYIEIDLGRQHLWYLVNGAVVFETDIVSGTMDGKHETPDGAFFIYDKQEGKVLRGERYEDGSYEYEYPTRYWMRVTNTGVGLHDVDYRARFGGEIYKTNGSHGCVNMSYADAQALYNMVPEKTPVAIYY